ncbi:MAG: NHL repeat-containing protein [Cyanobacteria bacterium P01_G01_bin.49]
MDKKTLSMSLILSTIVGSNLWALPAKAADLLVGSFNTNSVLRYNGLKGNFIDDFIPSSSGGLNGPVAITFGEDRNLYLISIFNHSILRYDGTTGAFIDDFVSSGSGGLFLPQDLTFGPDGNLYVSSTGTDQVLRYDGQSGELIDEFVTENSGGIDAPFGVRFGEDGNFYVSSTFTNEILRYDGQTGEFLDIFASGLELDGPGGITFGPDGNLYVANFTSNSDPVFLKRTITRHDGKTGELIDIFINNLDGRLNGGPVQPIFGPDGNLYVSVRDDNTVLRYDGQSGEFIDEFIQDGSGGLSTAGWLAFRSVDEPSSGKGLLALVAIGGMGMMVKRIRNAQ